MVKVPPGFRPDILNPGGVSDDSGNLLFDLQMERAVAQLTSTARIRSNIYLGKWRLKCQGLLQLEELADEVLFCKTQGLQFTEDLLEYLQTEDVLP